MSILIAGLGNIGAEYSNTRHNIGFKVLDTLAGVSGINFTVRRYGSVAELRHKGKSFILLKPSTYMNLSGKAVNYWLAAAKVDLENLLVVVDDVALPLGTLRMRKQGSDGGHNGLKNISEILGTDNFARLRIGIGNGYHPGGQIDYVLGEWSEDQLKELPAIFERASDSVKSFGTAGIERTMNLFNTK